MTNHTGMYKLNNEIRNVIKIIIIIIHSEH